MATHAHTTVRTVLKGAGICVSGSLNPVCTAIVSREPDALLIALGNRYEVVFGQWREAYEAWDAAENAFVPSIPLKETGLTVYLDEQRTLGIEAICKVSEDAWETLRWLQNDILQTPAIGATGMRVKADVLRLVFQSNEIAGGEDTAETAEYHADLLRAYAEEALRLGLGSNVFQ